MAKLADLPEPLRSHLDALPCPTFDDRPWVGGPPISQRRVALVSSAGLHRRGDRPFARNAADYRVIPADAADVVMSHISTNYDRTGFQADLNVVFPLDRLRELAEAGEIGSVAAHHYSFMGATPPEHMEPFARELAGQMKAERVDAVLLVPV
jgi:D-proline reductase (dithiol) PrdB